MGDRANVYVLNQWPEEGQPREGVYLYTHWGGTELPFIVKGALMRRERWNDGAYLTRIIFCEMINGDTGTTGYGISTRMCNNENRIIVIDPDNGTIGFKDERDDSSPYKTWPFEEYIGLSREEIEEAYHE